MKKDHHEKRNAYFMIRLSPEEKEIWKKLANLERTDCSEFIRGLVREQAKIKGLWS